MGRRRGKAHRPQPSKRKRESKPDGERVHDGRTNRREIVDNPAFREYYIGQGLITEETWPELLAVFRRELPITFRINATAAVREQLLGQLESESCLGLMDQPLEVEGRVVDRPSPLPWYPGKQGWYFAAGKSAIRKLKHAKAFRSWLVEETELGHFTRQEAVSMIPPLVLDAQSHHAILDMCASPGSKTSQLLTSLYQDARHGSETSGVPPEGFVVANDSEAKRAHLLTHNVKRLGCPQYITTLSDARMFPTILDGGPEEVGDIPKRDDPSKTVRRTFHRRVLFDRILCDVPCSGDGTVRKNPRAMSTWKTTGGIALHRLQLSIAKRGVHLLNDDGVFVYSTCSLNPLENEAVVAALLAMFPGELEVEDCSDRLPGLIRRPGLTTWRVLDKTGKVWFDTFAETEAAQGDYSYIHATMFPPSTEQEAEVAAAYASSSAAAASAAPAASSSSSSSSSSSASAPSIKEQLTRCMRIMPTDQDTGGFFIARLRRVKPLPFVAKVSIGRKSESAAIAADGANNSNDEDEEEAQSVAVTGDAESEDGASEPSSPDRKKPKTRLEKQNAYQSIAYNEVYMHLDDELKTKLRADMGLTDDFPYDGLVLHHTRSAMLQTRKHIRRIYFVGSKLARFLTSDDYHVPMVQAGVQMFERTTDVSSYRICQSAVYSVLPYLKPERLVDLTLEQCVELLKIGSLNHDVQQQLGLFERVQEMPTGACVGVFKSPEHKVHFALSMWRTDRSVSVMVNLRLKQSLLNALSFAFGREMGTAGKTALETLHDQEIAKQREEQQAAKAAAAAAAAAAAPESNGADKDEDSNAMEVDEEG